MKRPFRFALQATERNDRRPLVAAARQAESLGYDELFSSDHFGGGDPFIPLMVAAEATRTLRFGPLVLNNEFHHPALLARTAATVDRLTGGRLVLGLGTGYMQSEHDAIGLPLRRPGPRVSRFEESIVALRSLLDHGTAATDGEHHALAVDDLGIRPIQTRVPFLIGGHGRRVVSIAGHHADIFQFTGLTHLPAGEISLTGFSPDKVMKRSRWLEEAAGDREIERSALVQSTYVGDDAPAVLDRMSEEFELAPEIMEQTPFVLIGSLAQVVDKCQRLRAELGISHFVIRDAPGFAPVVAELAGR